MPHFGKWEPETIKTKLIRVDGKLLTGNRQPTMKTPDIYLYRQAWADSVEVA